MTWTAAPGVGVAPDQFALFRVAVTLPNTDIGQLPGHPDLLRWHGGALGSAAATRRWRARTPRADADPDRSAIGGRRQSPSPSVSASPAPAPAQASSQPAPDNTARWLAGAALVVGALGVGLALFMRRRS